ncbi:MAG: CoA transferase, partial [Acidobacteria bacterium]|nr:CoA transferase [Acidobacteriota bacterium]
SETVAAGGLRLRLPHQALGDVDLPAAPWTMSGASTKVRHLADDAWRVPPGTCWIEAPAPLPAPTAPELVDAAPLAGIRVLDLAAFVAGTFGPSILCHLGAEVVKVEPPGGDPYRDFPVSFAAFNQSKLGLGLDMKKADARAVFTELVEHADVVIDGVRPSVRARLGTDAASLLAINPRLVRCSVTGWGEQGPLAETPAFDPLLQSRSGLAVAQGGRQLPVVLGGLLVHDIGTGTLAAVGMLAALYQRELTGRGQEVALSLASTSTHYQCGELTRYAGKPPAPAGGPAWPGPSAVRRLYPCAEGWIVLGARTDAEADAVLDELGIAVPADGGAATAAHDGPLADAMGAALATSTASATADRLRARAVPAATVLPRTAALTDGWLAENGMFHHVAQPDLGDCTFVSGYATWPGAPIGYSGASPAVGEHSRQVLAAAGVAPDRIDALMASGAVHGTA